MAQLNCRVLKIAVFNRKLPDVPSQPLLDQKLDR